MFYLQQYNDMENGQCIPKLAKDRAVHKEDTPCFLVNIPIKINAYFINNVNFALKHRM
jgi:hypothetical protein